MTREVSKERLDRILDQHIWASMGVGLIPLPGADIAGLIGVQLNLLRKIADAYEVPFLKEAVKKLASSLIGGVLLTNVAPLAASVIPSSARPSEASPCRFSAVPRLMPQARCSSSILPQAARF